MSVIYNELFLKPQNNRERKAFHFNFKVYRFAEMKTPEKKNVNSSFHHQMAPAIEVVLDSPLFTTQSPVAILAPK